ncbi:hypothetical protein MBO12_06995, partial [Candidatus Saccharibacteria bacterium]|nr:hypothetical protein [Candidatus Saccharibacteria bacterium]
IGKHCFAILQKSSFNPTKTGRLVIILPNARLLTDHHRHCQAGIFKNVIILFLFTIPGGKILTVQQPSSIARSTILTKDRDISKPFINYHHLSLLNISHNITAH